MTRPDKKPLQSRGNTVLDFEVDSVELGIQLEAVTFSTIGRDVIFKLVNPASINPNAHILTY